MKRILTLVTILTAIILQSAAQPPMWRVRQMQNSMKKDTLWGAYCYQELNDQISGVNRVDTIFDILPLQDGEKMVYYVLADECTTSLKLYLHTEKGAKPMINVKVIEVNTGKVVCDKTLKNKFKGGADDAYIMQMQSLPSKSWYRIELTAEMWAAINSIDYFLFENDSKIRIKPSPVFMAPSVHLNDWESTDVNAPKGEAYDWAYMEIMLPKKYERKNTYVMSLGILSGYMGMQVVDDDDTRNYKHRVLFSMWDNGNTDTNASLPDYLRSGSLDWAEDVEISRFGGEGTGTKAMIYESPWQCDNWVQFISTCRPETNIITTKDRFGKDSTFAYTSTLVSAWYKEANEKQWRYLATHRESGYNHYINRWYSFLENFTDDGGEFYRRAYYRNGYLRAISDGKWYNRNKVGFGHTQGKADQPRYDYGHGATKNYANCFYLEQGGYTLLANDSDNVVPLATDFTPVDTINIEALWARTEKAIMAENTRMMDKLITEASEQADKLSAFKAIAKKQLAHANQFGYYAKKDLRDLEVTYNNGDTDDAAGLALYLKELAKHYMSLKYSYVAKAEHLGINRVYQLQTADNKTLVATADGSIGYSNDSDATDNLRNWTFTRQGNDSNKYIIYNIGTKKYLDPSAASKLSDKAVAVEVTLEKDNFNLKANGASINACRIIDNYYAGDLIKQ